MKLDHTKLADAGAATSILAWLSTIAVQTMPLVQWLAGVVAIVAGISAAWYHIKKTRRLR